MPSAENSSSARSSADMSSMFSGVSLRLSSRAPGMARLRLRFKKSALVVGLHVDERVAVGVVVDALKGQFGFRLQCAGGGQDARGLDAHHVFFRRLDGADREVLALGPADEVTLVAIVGRQQIARVFVGRVHQQVLARLQFPRRRWRG